MASERFLDYPRVTIDGDRVIYSPLAGLTYAIGAQDIEIKESTDAVPRRLDHALQNGALYGYQEHLRRRLVLHSSAFVHAGRAYGILGLSGWGKSTTAAHVRALGPGFLTDDILSLRADVDVVALAGPPKARLWPDAVRKIGLDVQALETVYEDVEKRFLDVTPVVDEAPLGGLYILDRSDAPLGLSPLGPADALLELVTHTYSVRLVEQRQEAWHFQMCSRVANSVPVKRLSVPQGLQYVDQAAQLIYADLQAVESP